jgi:hypothetical protein
MAIERTELLTVCRLSHLTGHWLPSREQLRDSAYQTPLRKDEHRFE